MSIFRGAKLYANVTNNKLNILNKETFTVVSDFKNAVFKLKSDIRKNDIEVTLEDIGSKFEYSYARTVYGVQGLTIDEPYTIHRWNRLSHKDKVVVVGRARKTEYINICHGCEICGAKIVFSSTSEQELNQRWENGTLEEQKELALDIIHRILKSKVSDDFNVSYWTSS